MKKTTSPIKSILLLGLLVSSIPTHAANWLILQGTEPPKATHKFWGFVQPSYTYDRGDELEGLMGPATGNNGERIAKSVVSPWFDDDKKLHFRRARVGVRGRFTGMMRNGFTEKMNYFTLFELAPNLMTYDPFGNRARQVAIDHVSLTFNHIPGARLRAGLFKTPGPEETYQAIHTFDYIEFTDFAAREVLERFAKGNQSCPGCSTTSVGTPVNKGYGFNAVRNWGVQLFESVKRNKWDLSYALMVGRGEGIHKKSDTDNNKELYFYGSAERDLPGGRGPRKNGVKFYAWRQQGQREFKSDPSDQTFDRIRQGVGFKALGKLFGGRFKHRVAVELSYAEGMIFIAPFGNVAGGNLMYATDKDNKARGVTVDYGFYFNTQWQLDARWHRNDLLYEQAKNIGPHTEREIEEITFGINYHFTPTQRLTANYIIRDAKAPNTQPNPVLANNVPIILDSLGDRVALQYTWIF